MKKHFARLAQTLNVKGYSFPKVHGTWFINHTRKGLDRLLKNWVLLAQCYENALEDNGQRANHAKIKGLLKKLKKWSFVKRLGCS